MWWSKKTKKPIISNKVKEAILNGTLTDLKGKSLRIYIDEIKHKANTPDAVILSIQVTDDKGDELIILHTEVEVIVGGSITVIDLDQSFNVCLS